MNEEDLKLVAECEKLVASTTKGPWTIDRSGSFSAIFGWNTDQPTNHVRCQITSWGGIKNEADLAFVQMAKFALPRLCAMLREQDKRARHAEEERDAFNARIAELEAEVARLKGKDKP